MLWLSLIFFGGLYFLQGAVLAFIINFQKPYLAGEGVTHEQIAWLTSAMLFPFIGKIFLGALSDRVSIGRFGRRKPYIFIGLLLTMVCYFSLASVNPAHEFSTYFILSVLATLGLALFDTTADGMAIDKTQDADQGTVQAAMLAGKSLGLITFSSVFGFVMEKQGTASAFLILSALTIPVMAGCYFYSAPDRTDPYEKAAEAAPPARTLFTSYFALFVLFGLAYSITSFGIDGIMTLFMDQKLKAVTSDIGLYGSMRGVGALMGALLGGFILSRSSKKTGAIFALVFLFIAGMANSQMSAEHYLPFAVLWGMAWGVQETVYITLAMSLSIGRWAATVFALTMMFSNIGTSIGEAVATSFTANYPYPLVIQGLSLWLLPCAVILGLYIRSAPRTYLHDVARSD
jgi:MFS transporter, PAT family, beta-lactamase induction signal transducer AmpG